MNIRKSTKVIIFLIIISVAITRLEIGAMPISQLKQFMIHFDGVTKIIKYLKYMKKLLKLYKFYKKLKKESLNELNKLREELRDLDPEFVAELYIASKGKNMDPRRKGQVKKDALIIKQFNHNRENRTDIVLLSGGHITSELGYIYSIFNFNEFKLDKTRWIDHITICETEFQETGFQSRKFILYIRGADFVRKYLKNNPRNTLKSFDINAGCISISPQKKNGSAFMVLFNKKGLPFFISYGDYDSKYNKNITGSLNKMSHIKCSSRIDFFEKFIRDYDSNLRSSFSARHIKTFDAFFIVQYCDPLDLRKIEVEEILKPGA